MPSPSSSSCGGDTLPNPDPCSLLGPGHLGPGGLRVSPALVTTPHPAVSPQQEQPQLHQHDRDSDCARGGAGGDGAARVRGSGDTGDWRDTGGHRGTLTHPPLFCQQLPACHHGAAHELAQAGGQPAPRGPWHQGGARLPGRVLHPRVPRGLSPLSPPQCHLPVLPPAAPQQGSQHRQRGHLAPRCPQPAGRPRPALPAGAGH